jgi:hypothetical protein
MIAPRRAKASPMRVAQRPPVKASALSFVAGASGRVGRDGPTKKVGEGEFEGDGDGFLFSCV